MYFIYSEDHFLLTKTVNKLVKNLLTEKEYEVENYSLIYNDISEIYTSLNTFSLFGEPKILIISDAWFATEEKISLHRNYSEEALYRILESKTDNVVIFTLNNERISKRLKIAKYIEENLEVTNVKTMQENEVLNYIKAFFTRNEKSITDHDAAFIFQSIPKDMQTLTNELTKLSHIESDVITLDDIKNNLSKYIDNDIFELSNAFVNNETKTFLKLYKDYLLMNDDISKLIALLSSTVVFFRDVNVMKQQGIRNEEIVQITKAHPYRVKIAISNKLNIRELNDKIKLLYYIQQGVLNNTMDKDNIVEYRFIKNMEDKNG
ncbi:DNA polymerase III subunit delta [Mesoplasma florum]|uniref:DNA polymerase III subunit delta n=1 Tax=Mesoplasma florum TaxID=2151 RepID=UPI000BE2833B|nr:DNA polymerase III subunit delta [Mesoplasma florum]ATI73331.1 DNA polymerase III subunit delta [Mesoplasma florum]AVN61043.1 DNA polymerase III subunit delta [Mesoplasma florum]AVN61732.1 DNA polymerase III subunit delta [Mesoplasma florum]